MSRWSEVSRAVTLRPVAGGSAALRREGDEVMVGWPGPAGGSKGWVGRMVG